MPVLSHHILCDINAFMAFGSCGDGAEIDVAGKETFGNIIFVNHLFERAYIHAVLLDPLFE